MFTVYILHSEKYNNRYIGVTSDLSRRITEHNRGMVKSTKNRRPLKLVYIENYMDKTEALKREKFFKSGKGREYLNNLEII